MKSAIYKGNIVHHRLGRVEHRFAHKLPWFLLDLEEIETLQQTHWKKESELEAQLATVESLRDELKGRLVRSDEDAKHRVEEAKNMAAQVRDELMQQIEIEKTRLETVEAQHQKEVEQLKSNLDKLDLETQQAIRAQVS